DSERERGAVPSLHSRQGLAAGVDADDDDEAPVRSVRPLWWAVGALSIALVTMLVWLVLGRSSPEPIRAVEPLAAAVPPPAPPAAVVEVPPVAAAQPAPVRAPLEAPPDPAPPPPVSRPPVERKSAAAKPPPSPARTVAAARPTKPAEASAREDDAPVPSISELPDDIRRQLPTLSVGGASYSKNPSSRMLILNGQVFREGDKVANDLVLEQIRLKSAVLSFRGRRYSVSF
ncbi:MAG TPA: general secretion pathway protein GspB, partial [Rhizobacter sp.]